MSDENNAEPKVVNRRAWLKLLGAGAASGVLPLSGAAAEDSMGGMHHPAPKPVSPADEPVPVYEFLNGDEAAFIEAVIDTFIPADDVGPGALELGVAGFIDR